MKILLTGASSYVGARLFIDIEKNFDIVGTYHGTKLSEKLIHLNVTDPEEINQTLRKYKPEIIIHAAANADARWCEANPELAIALNQKSTKTIVNTANEIGSKVILISSFVAKEPINIYGKTKAESEKFVKETKAGFIIIRPSLIIGYSPNTVNDRPFNRILKNIDEKVKAIYDTSWKFQPTYLGHISEIISIIIERNILNQTIPVAVNEIKTRFDIARDILSAFNIDVIPIDNHDLTPVVVDSLSKLKELNLPKYTYEEIINKIVGEIKNRNRFSKI